MGFDAGREGCGLWFSEVEESRAELPYTRYGVGGHCLRLESMTSLSVWRAVRGILGPQKSSVHIHAAGSQHEVAYVDGVLGRL